MHGKYKQDCVNVCCLFCCVFKCLLALQKESYVSTGTANLDRYRSGEYWRDFFATFTASFTLLKICKVGPQAENFMYLTHSPFCELREVGAAVVHQWITTRGPVLGWHSDQ